MSQRRSSEETVLIARSVIAKQGVETAVEYYSDWPSLSARITRESVIVSTLGGNRQQVGEKWVLEVECEEGKRERAYEIHNAVWRSKREVFRGDRAADTWENKLSSGKMSQEEYDRLMKRRRSMVNE